MESLRFFPLIYKKKKSSGWAIASDDGSAPNHAAPETGD